MKLLKITEVNENELIYYLSMWENEEIIPKILSEYKGMKNPNYIIKGILKAQLGNKEYVPSCLYFLEVNNKIVGNIQLRYELNEYLLNYAGHIGYGIIPSARNKGYASKMLNMVLKEASKYGLKKVLITCDAKNIYSKKIIEKNGGVFENETTVLRYWIDL